ncbi:MAG: hypothetical protein DWQ09_00220 [Proteobacteria bacterium]|nr:MAG: hypothetical protein DWQ09_00220 [Pseudomonadota bacterium]
MGELALIIDHEACWGCLACEVACKQENNTDHGVKLIDVLEDGPKLVDGELAFTYNVNACTHSLCDGHPCIEVCPVFCIESRDDGIVVMDYDECIGCEICVDACPTGAITMNHGENITQKCNLCHHRVEKGLIPACADNICLGHCIYFGDPKEIASIIESKRRRRRGEAQEHPAEIRMKYRTIN